MTTLVSNARVLLKSNVTNPLPLMFCISKDVVGYSGYSYITYYIPSYLNQSSLFSVVQNVPPSSTFLFLSAFPGTQPIWIHSLQYLQTRRKLMESAKLWFCAWDLLWKTHLTGTSHTHTQNVRKWLELHALQKCVWRISSPLRCVRMCEWVADPTSFRTHTQQFLIA